MKYLKEIHLALSVGLVSLLILESLWPGVVASRLNLNYCLIFWLFTAILRLFLQDYMRSHEGTNH